MKNFPLEKLSYVKKYALLVVYFSILWLILPISLGILFSYLLFPVVQYLHRKLKIPFFISTIIISSIIIMMIYFLFHLSIQSIITLYPEIKSQVAQLSIMESANFNFFEKILTKSISYVDSVLINIGNYLQDIFSYLFDLFIFIMAFYFSLFESRKNRLWFFLYVPKPYRQEWKRYFTKGINLFGYFLYVELQLFVITFILLSFGLALLNFEHPIYKSFLISLADVLPFFGIGIFLIPIAIYFFVVNETMLGASVLILYIFIQLTRQLLESFLWSSTFHLRTIHTFFITATSLLIFGFYGILLSPLFLLIAVKFKQHSISE